MLRLRTARWNEPRTAEDGTRILISRYRPRALPKKDETWDEWRKELGPSVALHADFYGKHGPPIGILEYVRRYHEEMRERHAEVDALVTRLRAGEALTLLCSSACTVPQQCHRTLLAKLLRAAVEGAAM